MCALSRSRGRWLGIFFTVACQHEAPSQPLGSSAVPQGPGTTTSAALGNTGASSTAPSASVAVSGTSAVDGGATSGVIDAASEGTASADGCPVVPPIPELSDATLQLPIIWASGAQPLTLGAPAQASDEVPYSINYLKMFLSSFELERADGTRAAAQVVTDTGEIAPYGLAYLDLENTDAKLYLRAPSGEYTGISFNVGLPLACYLPGHPATRVPPLEFNGPMYWTWGDSFLFMRLEGRCQEGGGDTAMSYHLGDPSNSVTCPVHLPIELTLNSGETATSVPALRIDVGQIVAPVPEGASRILEGAWLFDNLVAEGTFSFEP
jgi:hypothetical protein